jgi:hypothetical protein
MSTLKLTTKYTISNLMMGIDTLSVYQVIIRLDLVHYASVPVGPVTTSDTPALNVTLSTVTDVHMVAY